MNLEAESIKPARDAPDFPDFPVDKQELAIKYCLGQLSFEAYERDQICRYVCGSWGGFVRVNESLVHKTLDALAEMSSDDEKYLYLRPDSRMLLMALMYWAKDQILLGFTGATIDTNYFTVERAVYSFNRHAELVSLKEHQSTRAEKLKPRKSKHNVKYNIWLYEPVVCYVATHYGANTLSLDYLLREMEAPLQYEPRDKTFDTFEDLAKETVPFTGPKYKADNEMLYGLLIDLLRDTTAMSLLPKDHHKSKDGRSVYLTLCKYYKRSQGQVVMNNKSAEQALSRSVYQGQPRESFDEFVSDLQNAFKLFEQANNGISDQDKFDFLFKGLQCQRQHYISAYVSQIEQQRVSNPFYTFDDAIAYLTNEMTNEMFHLPVTTYDRRYTSKVGSQKTNSNSSKKRKNGDQNDYDDWMSDSEYAQLSPDERKELYNKRRRRKSCNSKAGSQKTNSKKRKNEDQNDYDDWMSNSEYAQLSPDEKKELYERRQCRKGKQKNGDRDKKKYSKATRDVKGANSVDVAAIYKEAFALGREVGATELVRPASVPDNDAPSAASFRSLSVRTIPDSLAIHRRN